MNIIPPFSDPTLFVTTLSTQYFGVTLFVLIFLLLSCGYLIWCNQRKGGTGKGIILYLIMLFLMSLLYAVVDIREEQGEQNDLSDGVSVVYDVKVHGGRTYIYERSIY